MSESIPQVSGDLAPGLETTGAFVGKAVIGEEFDFDQLLIPDYDNSSLTVEDAAVRGPRAAGQGADLYAAGSSNIDNAAQNLGLSTEQYKSARADGQLRPQSGNPGEVTRLSDEARAAIVNE